VEGVRASLTVHLPLRLAEIEQPYQGAVLIEVVRDGVSHGVASDYFDHERILDEVVNRCALIFKMQYGASGYGYPHVIPGGYVPQRPYFNRYLPGLRL